MEDIKKEDLITKSETSDIVYDGERQHFNNIKDIKAVNGMVVIQVYGKKEKGDKGADLQDVVLTVRQAAERAASLNRIASKLPEKDRKVADDIVDQVIAKILEAREQVIAIGNKL